MRIHTHICSSRICVYTRTFVLSKHVNTYAKFVLLECVYTSRSADVRTKIFPVYTRENSRANIYTYMYA